MACEECTASETKRIKWVVTFTKATEMSGAECERKRHREMEKNRTKNKIKTGSQKRPTLTDERFSSTVARNWGVLKNTSAVGVV